MKNNRELSQEQTSELIKILETRFLSNVKLHKDISWEDVRKKLETNSEKLWFLYQMELTGGEPDVVDHDKNSGEYIFFDCSKESPKGRRSLCYDKEALESRKENKPENSAIELALTMGIEVLTEEQYRYLQSLSKFDEKTSSWIQTPENIRKLGGAVFCDFRYNTVFRYHNGAESYYASRGFRGSLRI